MRSCCFRVFLLGVLIFSWFLYAQQNHPDFPVLTGQYLGQKPPGEEPVIFAPGIVTLEQMNHASPTFSTDGKNVFWEEYSEEPSYTKIKTSRLINDRWNRPEFLEFPGHDILGSPFMHPAKNRLYFISQNWLDEKGASYKENIWYVDKKGDRWSKPRPLGSVVNSKLIHWQFSVAENGNLYFSTVKTGMFQSRFVEGRYLKPKKVSEVLHSGYRGTTPFISPDESFIIFASSDLADCLGELDLYIGYRKIDGSWTQPINLGNRINSSKHDMCPIMTPDQKYLFFISRRREEFDVYWVKASFIKNRN